MAIYARRVGPLRTAWNYHALHSKGADQHKLKCKSIPSKSAEIFFFFNSKGNHSYSLFTLYESSHGATSAKILPIAITHLRVCLISMSHSLASYCVIIIRPLTRYFSILLFIQLQWILIHDWSCSDIMLDDCAQRGHRDVTLDTQWSGQAFRFPASQPAIHL